MINKHLEYMINGITDNKVQELDNLCNLKLINIDKKKLKYVYLLYNSLYPSINIIHFIKNISKYNYDITYLKKLMDNPLLHPMHQNSSQSYSYYLKNKTNNDVYESKIFWNNFFLKYNVNTPTIKAIVINGNVITNYSSILKLLEHNKNEPTKLLNAILKNNHENGDDIINKDIKKYDAIFKNSIIKPIYGKQGTDVKVYKSHNSIPKKEGMFIIQERVKNINYNGHFRIVTYWNKEKNTHENLYTYLYIQEDKTKIQSNGHQGATTYQVKL